MGETSENGETGILVLQTGTWRNIMGIWDLIVLVVGLQILSKYFMALLMK